MTTRVTISGGTTRVTVGGTTKRITLSRSTVAAIANNRPTTTITSRNSAVTVSSAAPSITVGSAMGVQGPAGAAGASGGTIAPISFSYGDAAGAIYTPSVAGTITWIRLVVTTAFNGSGAALQLGTLASPGVAMASTNSDPAEAGEYELTADLHLDANEALRLTITPGGGATQGAGRIFLNFIPD